MTDFTWPNFPAIRFQLRIDPLTKGFASQYSNQVQVVDMLAECWRAQIDIAPDVLKSQGRSIQAFFDRLKGQANRIILWDLMLPAPSGTMRGSPTVSATVAQLANMVPIATTAGATLNAGDMIGIGGQLCRVMANATADGSGAMTVEVAPRIRATSVASGTAVVWNQPTAPFILNTPGGIAVDWMPGYFNSPSIDLRESF